MRSDALVADARLAGAGFLGCAPEEVVFGAEHDDAQLRALAHGRPGAARRRRDPRHEARPRRQRRPVARARARPRAHRSARRAPRRHHARPRRPQVEALGADADRRVPARLERRRDARRRATRRRAGARGGRARVGGRRALRAARTDRRRRARRRRPDLLAVQVLRAAPRTGLRPRRGARALAAVQGAPRRRRAGRQPLRDGHARARAARGLRRRGRLRRRRRLGPDPRARAGARRAAPRGASRTAGASTGSPTMEGRVPTFAVTHADADAGRRRLATRGAEDRRVGRQLLRRRGDGPARAARRSRPHRDRPLQHGGRGRPAARSACARSRRPSAASACRQSCARTCGSRPRRRRTTPGRA